LLVVKHNRKTKYLFGFTMDDTTRLQLLDIRTFSSIRKIIKKNKIIISPEIYRELYERWLSDDANRIRSDNVIIGKWIEKSAINKFIVKYYQPIIKDINENFENITHNFFIKIVCRKILLSRTYRPIPRNNEIFELLGGEYTYVALLDIFNFITIDAGQIRINDLQRKIIREYDYKFDDDYLEVFNKIFAESPEKEQLLYIDYFPRKLNILGRCEVSPDIKKKFVLKVWNDFSLPKLKQELPMMMVISWCRGNNYDYMIKLMLESYYVIKPLFFMDFPPIKRYFKLYHAEILEYLFLNFNVKNSGIVSVIENCVPKEKQREYYVHLVKLLGEMKLFMFNIPIVKRLIQVFWDEKLYMKHFIHTPTDRYMLAQFCIKRKIPTFNIIDLKTLDNLVRIYVSYDVYKYALSCELFDVINEFILICNGAKTPEDRDKLYRNHLVQALQDFILLVPDKNIQIVRERIFRRLDTFEMYTVLYEIKFSKEMEYLYYDLFHDLDYRVNSFERAYNIVQNTGVHLERIIRHFPESHQIATITKIMCNFNQYLKNMK